MATAVDIITYLNKTPETSSPKQNNDADFEKVFSAVSKNYNDDNTSKNTDSKAKNSTDYNQNQPEQKINDNQKQSDNKQKIEDNSSETGYEQNEKNIQEKTDKNNSGNTEGKSEVKTEQKTDIESNKNQEQTVQNTTEQDNLNLLEEINIQANNQINQQAEVIAETPVIDIIPVRAELNSQSEKIQEQPPQVQIKNSTASAQVISNIQNRDTVQTNQVNNQNSVEKKPDTISITPTTTQVEQQATVQALVNDQLNNQTPITENNQQTTQVPVQTIPQNQLETSTISAQEINNNYADENAQQIVTAQNNQKDLIQQATIQESTSQKGQIVDLIKASTIKELTQTQTQNIQIQDASTTDMIIQDNSEINEQMPVIATNLATANKAIVNQNNNDNNIKDITVKNPLTQEIIDKTNAKVVNLESSGSKSSNSDLLSKQSPQEQLVKLSLNADNKTENTNTLLTNISNTNIQTTFDKTLNSIQNQTPKELSKTDILSQIHNQLDNFGQDEGTTKVTIVLKPENLGRIQLELVNSKEGLTAKMTTDNAQVKQLLDKNLDSLKDTIGTQGVNVNSVSVKIENTQNQTNEQFAYDEHQEKNNQQQSNNPQNKDQDESNFANEVNSKINSEKENEETAYNSEINYKV